MKESSNQFWLDREKRQRKKDIKAENELESKIDALFNSLYQKICSLLDSAYVKYAENGELRMGILSKSADKDEILTYLEKVSKTASRTGFSRKADEAMPAYHVGENISRHKLLMMNIDADIVDTSNKAEKLIQDALTERVSHEVERQATVFGKTILGLLPNLQTLVDESFKHEKWSDRLWNNQETLREKLSKTMKDYLIRGIPTTSAMSEFKKLLRKDVKFNSYCCRRILVTERQRVAGQAQMEIYDQCGVEWYKYIAEPGCCEICSALDGKKFKVKDAVPSVNLRPIHPNCRCGTTMTTGGTDDDFDEWLDTFSEHGMDYDEWLKSREKPNIDLGEFSTCFDKEDQEKITGLIQNASPDIQDFWNKCIQYVNVKDSNYKGVDHYSKLRGGLFFNAKNTAEGDSIDTPFQVLFHEAVHNMDSVASSVIQTGRTNALVGVASKDLTNGKLKKALDDAFARNITQWQVEQGGKYLTKAGKPRKPTNKIKIDYLWDLRDRYGAGNRTVSDVSDMLEAVSLISRPLGVGHGRSYWEQKSISSGKKTYSEHMQCAEAFAEIVSAEICNPESFALIQEMFPEAVDVAHELMRDIVKRLK